ncbi:MAG: pimelyl-ACP methyl ester esterase BioV [Campylobacterales bacterium]|nr:pimelyl-ACP methyl ester esterase BioV [Campylobacterales bacterium]
MKFFSGFCLKNEQELFESFLDQTDYTVAGFSYGAQKAIEYALSTTQRIERIILLSPAFFKTQSKSFLRAQMHYFSADKDKYIQNFLTNISLPNSKIDLEKYISDGSIQQLEKLLTYEWDEDMLISLNNRGIKIEVFLGEEDRIIDSKSALDFFSKYSTTYLIKKAGHLLNVK